MKRILFIFIILVGGYLLFQAVTNLNFSSAKNTNVALSDRVDTIHFDISSLQLIIVPQDREDLETNYEGRGKVKVEKKGDTIRIEQQKPWFSAFSLFENNRLYVYVPEDFNKEMAIDIGSGNVELAGESPENPFVLDELSINLSSGNIHLEHVSVTDFDHNGSSGNLKADFFTAKKSSIDISSGSARMREYKGELDAQVSSGKLEVQMSELNDAIEVEVSSGNVELDLPDDAEFTLKGKVGSGNISFDFPLTVTEQGKKEINGTVGSGEHEISIDVSSGHARIY